MEAIATAGFFVFAASLTLAAAQPLLLDLVGEPLVLGDEPTVVGMLDTRGFSTISFLALSSSFAST